MLRLKDQNGIALIMVIGVIATLLVMGATLVVLTANVQSNTAQERTRSKSFDVAEGAMDFYMSQLAGAWPKGTTPAPTFNLSEPPSPGFRSLAQFASTAEYPNPQSSLVPFASAVSYDNSIPGDPINGVPTWTTIVGYDLANSPHSDANNDGKVWIVAKGATGAKRSAIQSEVTQVPVNTQFPSGIAVYAGGNLTSNGGGNNPKISVEDSGGGGVTGYVAGTIDTVQVFDTSSANPITPVIGSQGETVPSLTDLIPQSMVDQIISLSQSLSGGSNSGSRYYDSTNANPNGPDTVPTDKSGVTVIRVPDGTSVSLGNNGSINSLTSPGILMILGPVDPTGNNQNLGNNITLDMGGNNEFYGVLYTDGRMYSSHGTPDIHGMLVCKSNLDMKGTPNILYNAGVIANLANRWTLTVSLVPNTWREIQP